MRLYVPATPALLGQYRDAGTIPADVERVVAPDESEDAEYSALLTAADLAAALGAARRVVIVAEGASDDAAIAFRDVVAVHADVEDNADAEEDLGWFAVQEVDQVIGA